MWCLFLWSLIHTLDSVPASYLAWTSCCGRSPLVVLSLSSTRARSHSPVSKGRRSWSRSRSRLYRSPAASAGSLRGELLREPSHQSHRSQSPSRASSGCWSASPDGARRPSQLFRSLHLGTRRSSPRSSLDFVSVVAVLRSLNELPEAPLESHTGGSFREPQDLWL